MSRRSSAYGSPPSCARRLRDLAQQLGIAEVVRRAVAVAHEEVVVDPLRVGELLEQRQDVLGERRLGRRREPPAGVGVVDHVVHRLRRHDVGPVVRRRGDHPRGIDRNPRAADAHDRVHRAVGDVVVPAGVVRERDRAACRDRTCRSRRGRPGTAAVPRRRCGARRDRRARPRICRCRMRAGAAFAPATVRGPGSMSSRSRSAPVIAALRRAATAPIATGVSIGKRSSAKLKSYQLDFLFAT